MIACMQGLYIFIATVPNPVPSYGATGEQLRMDEPRGMHAYNIAIQHKLILHVLFLTEQLSVSTNS